MHCRAITARTLTSACLRYLLLTYLFTYLLTYLLTDLLTCLLAYLLTCLLSLLHAVLHEHAAVHLGGLGVVERELPGRSRRRHRRCPDARRPWLGRWRLDPPPLGWLGLGVGLGLLDDGVSFRLEVVWD